MNYTLVVVAHPDTNPGAETAFRFAEALLRQKHSITRLFFFSDGAFNAITHGNNTKLPARWQQLISEHHLDAVICVSSAATRGIGNQQGQTKPLTGFEISGLGQLVDATTQSERLVTFG